MAAAGAPTAILTPGVIYEDSPTSRGRCGVLLTFSNFGLFFAPVGGGAVARRAAEAEHERRVQVQLSELERRASELGAREAEAERGAAAAATAAARRRGAGGARGGGARGGGGAASERAAERALQRELRSAADAASMARSAELEERARRVEGEKASLDQAAAQLLRSAPTHTRSSPAPELRPRTC